MGKNKDWRCERLSLLTFFAAAKKVPPRTGATLANQKQTADASKYKSKSKKPKQATPRRRQYRRLASQAKKPNF
ncbi:hypothetical protein PPMP20_05845 [Paraburkholderia phymatum]|uniref:hypothetical protein n=1 Tax=Paraburkholderia phymatum TaxID=148447 RepID=UPI0012FDC7C2|nr:hypothetical protein [Paraburkholderia phymatum]